MNTLIKLLSSSPCTLALVALFALGGTGCALQGGPPVAEDEESVSSAQSNGDDDGASTSERNRELAQPIAPDRGDLGHCNSCGPGPQPWQNPIHVTSAR